MRLGSIPDQFRTDSGPIPGPIPDQNLKHLKLKDHNEKQIITYKKDL